MIHEIRSNQPTPVSRPQAGPAPSAAPELPVQAEPADQVSVGKASPLDKILAATSAEAAALEQELGEHVPGEVLVKLKPQLGKSQDRFVERYGAQVLHRFETPKGMFKSSQGDLMQLKLPAGMTTAQALAAMKDDPRVEFVEPNLVFHLDDIPGEAPGAGKVPNDLDSKLYGLDNQGQDGGKADADIDAPEAWKITTGTRDGAVIAVIDTGIDYNHPDLKNNMWVNPGEVPGDGVDNDGNGVVDDVYGYNAFANTGDPMDGHSHGTHCAGTIAAEGDNGEGVVGVNWKARLMAVKIFSDAGRTDVASILRGINYSTKMGARITSNSWGGGGFSQAIKEAFESSNAMHIMAAGNSGSNNDKRPHYPSSYDSSNNVAVAATDRNDQLARFSCYGEGSVDVGAPGVDIYSTVPGGGYASKSGTSMATPHVAGLAGLLVAQFPEINNQELKDRLLGSVDRIDSLDKKVVSGGRINAARSLETDEVAPGAPVDFGVIAARPDGVTLRWTSSGDDGWCGGPPSSFEVRVADRPIVDGEAAEGQVSFSQAAVVSTSAPAETGLFNETSHKVQPSTSERTLYFALKVKDNVGNTSPMASTVALVPAQAAELS